MRSMRFTLRDLLWCTALISAGLGVPILSLHICGNRPIDRGWPEVLAFFGFTASPLLIGAGIACPFVRIRGPDLYRRPTRSELISLITVIAGIAIVVYVMFFMPNIGL